ASIAAPAPTPEAAGVDAAALRRRTAPIPAPAPASVAAAEKFPVKWWDLAVLGALLSINFVLGISSPGASYPAPGLNMFLLLAYMFVVAIRNARLNIGIDTWKSFSIYLGIALLLIPFGLAIDWINGVEKFENFGLTFGLAIIAIIVAAIAN